jgi:hypothetical protein
VDPRYDEHPRQWLCRVLTHPRIAEALLLLLALGVIVKVIADPAQAG